MQRRQPLCRGPIFESQMALHQELNPLELCLHNIKALGLMRVSCYLTFDNYLWRQLVLHPLLHVQRLTTIKTKYFVLRSDNAIDIESSAAHNVWTSSPRVNKILDKGYHKTDGQVLLFFSIIKRQATCLSQSDATNTSRI